MANPEEVQPPSGPSPAEATPAPAGAGPSRYAITFGEVAIAHVGGKEVGNGIASRGFTVQELEAAAEAIKARGGRAHVTPLSDILPPSLQTSETAAAVLVVRDGAALLLGCLDAADQLLREQAESVCYDTMYWDTRRKRPLHKRARHNMVFGEEEVAASDGYQQCTVRAFAALPLLNRVRERLPSVFGSGAQGLHAEGNHYFEERSGIGFHGDSERKIVICLSLGQPTTLRYCWRMPGSSEHTLPPVDVQVGHGDVYVMSEKATGYDWRYTSRPRLVHAAGASKYTGA